MSSNKIFSLGLDIGSSSIKAAIIDIEQQVTVASVKYPDSEMSIMSPQSDWAEQDPQLWWDYVLQAIGLALTQSQINVKDIKCIGISYQMHGLVALDINGNIVRPSIIWCDSRAITVGQELTDNLDTAIIENHLYNTIGNFTAAKLYWVKKNEPSVFDQIYKIMLPGDYIAYRMSGSMTTTFSGMSEGIMYDFKQHMVSKEVLGVAGFDENIIPECGNSFDKLAYTNEVLESSLGIPKGTPISYRAGDQPNNALSLGILHKGEAAATGGTSGVVYAVSDSVVFDKEGRVNSFAHVNHNANQQRIGTLLCLNGTGIFYNWVRKQYYGDTPYSILEQDALSIDIGSSGLICMPFGNGAERMLSNRILGASMHHLDFNRHDRAHVVRACLESIAFAFMYGLEAMQSLGIDIHKIRAGNDNLFQSSIFSQTLASISGSEITLYETTGSVGAAYGAAFGSGYYNDLDMAMQHLKKIKTIEPDNITLYLEAYYRWKHIFKQL